MTEKLAKQFADSSKDPGTTLTFFNLLLKRKEGRGPIFGKYSVVLGQDDWKVIAYGEGRDPRNVEMEDRSREDDPQFLNTEIIFSYDKPRVMTEKEAFAYYRFNALKCFFVKHGLMLEQY